MRTPTFLQIVRDYANIICSQISSRRAQRYTFKLKYSDFTEIRAFVHVWHSRFSCVCLSPPLTLQKTIQERAAQESLRKNLNKVVHGRNSELRIARTFKLSHSFYMT